MAPGTSRLIVNNHIPEDVMYDAIFPRLPYKSVMRLKAVWKNVREKITDPIFSAKQSSMCPLCPAIVHIGRSTKKSYEYTMELLSSTPANVGIPSSRLDFLGYRTEDVQFFLLGSSNGLLCICCKPYHKGPLTPTTFHIVNPTTKKSQLIPGGTEHLYWRRAVGIVFDPLDQATTSLQKFQIVHAFPIFIGTHDTFLEFCFLIFSSDTGRWVMSDTRLDANIEKSFCKKVVYTCGYLYWEYEDDLLWFDVTTHKAGTIKMPKKIQVSMPEEWERHSIDASNNGTLMCTMINKDGLAMFEMVKLGEPIRWELKHRKGWKDIVDMNSNAFQFCHQMKLRNAWQSKFHEKWFVRPLGLESGRWVYLGVKLIHKTPEKVLRYDVETGMAEDTGKVLDNAYNMEPTFGYRNSMADIPPINAAASKDGICDGESGCICAPDSSEDEA